MLDDFIDKIKAFSDKNRLRMLHLLSQEELCVCEIMQILGIHQSLASAGLNILRLNGFIKSTKRGKWSYYSINRNRTPLIEELLKLIVFLKDDEVILSDNKKLNSLGRGLCEINLEGGINA